MVRKFILSLIMVLTVVDIHADANTEQTIFDPRFRTLYVGVEDLFMAPPVIRLNTTDRINISFDCIGDDFSDLQYRLVHCNADWTPSRLLDSEFVDGFNSTDIEDWGYSSDTYVHYVNYHISVPDDNCPILASGNYLLQVYERDDPDNVLLQARFSVSENSVAGTAVASPRTDRGINDQWQQLSVELNTEGADIVNPYTDLVLVLSQNNHKATQRQITVPSRAMTGRVIYEHMPELIFPAGNEYRRFETTDVRTAGMHVDSIRFGGSNYHVWLTPDAPRDDKMYNFDRTQHGRFLVREHNATDSDLGADYVTVHFTLDSPYMPEADVYVDGGWTHGAFTSANRMTYDPAARCYKIEIPLKQGSYNYRYITLPRNDASAKVMRGSEVSPYEIEGNHYETLNEYTINIFSRRPGARADRLTGVISVMP